MSRAACAGFVCRTTDFQYRLMHSNHLPNEPRGNTITGWRSAAAVLALAFVGLVAGGVTGSSLNISLDGSEFVVGEVRSLAGSPKAIRSDEHSVATPIAIAQKSHDPPFPVVNRNLGPDGQNMLLTGAPVRHVAALARPATWGFFLFDLRRALAWQWWFPVFGCLFAIWGTMGFLMRGHWRLGLGLSAIFCSSAYVVAWSNWPANATSFPAAAFCLFMLIMSSNSAPKLVLLSSGLALALAGYVLVLYPPWQISLGYLFLVIAAGVVIRDRLYAELNWRRVLAIITAIVLAGAICFQWYADASTAIEIMNATIYPGRRVAEAGGEIPAWKMLRGYLNFHTLYHDNGGLINQSEAASFPYFFPVLLVSAFIGLFKRHMPSWPEIGLLAFCLVVAWFQLVGLPPALAELSLWGRVPPFRTDLALGLASIFWCGLVLSAPSPQMPRDNWGSINALVVAGVWAAISISAMHATPEPIRSGVTSTVILEVGLLIAISGFLLLTGRAAAFVVINLIFCAAVSLWFNPISLAPEEISVAKELERLDAGRQSRMLVIDNWTARPMMLLAAGVPVANGTFMYPQASIWSKLDPTGSQSEITNRFQGLTYLPGRVTEAVGYRLEMPHYDQVRVVFDAARFDFRLTSANAVLAPAAMSPSLSGNPHLRSVGQVGGWVMFDVR
jgi:hypothetical protein